MISTNKSFHHWLRISFCIFLRVYSLSTERFSPFLMLSSGLPIFKWSNNEEQREAFFDGENFRKNERKIFHRI
jgi:hypothetical protein